MSSKDSNSMSGCTIAVIVIVSVLVLALIVVLIVQAVNCSNSQQSAAVVVAPSASGARFNAGRTGPPPHAQAQAPRRYNAAQAPMQGPVQARRPANSRVLAAQGMFNAPFPQPNPMPQAQLQMPPTMPQLADILPGVPSSLNVGEVNQDIMSTEVYGTTAMPYNENNYMEDPAMLTPSSSTDIRGIQTFMPNFAGTVGQIMDNGETGNQVDPSTGLPTFTPGQLMRSQLLGGQGAGSFLRREQDPLTGLRKTVGRNLNGPQVVRRDLEVRRKQINAARLDSPTLEIGSDFNNGEFMVN
jgi:hypothetical protein